MSAAVDRTPVMIMAGGKGSRLAPLTVHRAKPAVPFGGTYRIIDFVLSNFLNSGYRRIYLLTQFMASSLIRHQSRNWQMAGMFIEMVPAQMRKGEFWYRGTADSVYQNVNLIEETRADHVAIFGGDHIYKFAIDQMQEFHCDTDADLTISAFPVPREEAHQFGVMHVNAEGRITAFQEKPADPPTIPGRPDTSLVSMGNYIFKKSVLLEALRAMADEPDTQHDFGKNIIPDLLQQGARIFAYDFGTNRIPGEPEGAEPYWRDVGTIDSYVQANMDMRSPLPRVNLYNRDWRIRTAQRHYPPARFVRHQGAHAADVIDSLVCRGCIVSSAHVERCLVGYDSFVHVGSSTVDSILISGCDVGAEARLRNVLFDKNCSVEPGTVIGEDPEHDRERFPFISPGGVVVMPKGSHIPREGPIELAHDMADLLRQDPSTRDLMQEYEGRYTISDRDRRSHHSAGPRYRRFGPGAVSTY